MEPAKLGLTNYHGTAAWDDRAALGSGQSCWGRSSVGGWGTLCTMCSVLFPARQVKGREPSAGPVGTCSGILESHQFQHYRGNGALR